MLNCTGNKIPLICVFAAIAIVFIHGLSLMVAPGAPEVREPEARAWAVAEDEPARPKAGVVFMSYSDPRIDGHCHGTSPREVVYAGRLLKKVMKPAYPTLLFANKATKAFPRHVHGIFDDVRELNLNASLYTTEHAGAVQSLLSAASDDCRHEASVAMLCKLYAYLQSPFARTLFLDTDVFVLQPSLPHSLLAHTLRLADIAAPVNPAHDTVPHAPLLCFGMVAFHAQNPEVRRIFSNAVVRMALRDGTARFGDQEAFYLEWTEGAYHHLRVMPLTEEYYCPQVPVVKGGAVWTTSWSFKRDPAKGGRLAHRPYKCRAVRGHDYVPGGRKPLGLLD